VLAYLTPPAAYVEESAGDGVGGLGSVKDVDPFNDETVACEQGFLEARGEDPHVDCESAAAGQRQDLGARRIWTGARRSGGVGVQDGEQQSAARLEGLSEGGEEPVGIDLAMR
jgi:hypothetical protein